MKLEFNRKSIIRVLSITSLLIFFLPFFQMCSDENIKNSSGFIKSYATAKTEEEKEIAFQKNKKEFSMSGYDLAMSFEPVFSGFTAIMFLNITVVICVLRKHYNLLFFVFLNLIIAVISLLGLAFTLPDLTQIRYGMILSLLNTTLLFCFIYKDREIIYNNT